MKRIIPLVILGLFTLVGCSREDELDVERQEEVRSEDIREDQQDLPQNQDYMDVDEVKEED
jgi:uncharacterized protein YcfL